MTHSVIVKRLTENSVLFNTIHVIQQRFDTIPAEKDHLGACIEYQRYFKAVPLLRKMKYKKVIQICHIGFKYN